ncbi:MAG TPA: alpha-(1-_3)-arabinofuranosyltransferase family protein [Trebonia sp.]
MPRVRRDSRFTLGFVAFSFALAFWQMPGRATSDTKIDLYVDPVRFLKSVASVWTYTTDLGEVHSAQYGGYLWPMGPFFALFHILGLSPWVVERLWLGAVLALSVWGLLKLLDVLIGRPRGVAHLVATAFYLLNPYTVVFTARTTITLLGYAALPWLLLAVYHGVRTHRGWRAWWWPAAFALIFDSTGGGVNAAVVFFMAVGPVVLMVYEPAMGHVRWRAAGAFFARAVTLSVLASLWWILALLVHVRFGINFLQYTEQPRTIWGTNSITESLRLMGYWTSYLGAGYPTSRFAYFSDGPTLLFDVPVVAATLILPALACLGFVWSRRWRYGPFFMLMVLIGVVIMAAGFPDGTPLRRVMEYVYYHVAVVSFLRTVDKAAPLVALGLACLLGLAAGVAWARLRALRLSRLRRPALIAAPLILAGLIILASLPLWQGSAPDRQITWSRIPSAWTDVGHSLDAHLPVNSRAVVLPGQVFGFYKWGGTVDPILPRLTNRPVAIRYETPYSDLHADDLLVTIDTLVQQDRLFAGQLKPLLALIGARSVVSGTDDDTIRSGAVDPSIAALGLSTQGLGAPRNYGPVSAVPAAAGNIDPTQRLAEVRQFSVPAGRGIVHVDQGRDTVVDGSAAGLADLAAFNALAPDGPIFYAGDLSTRAIRTAAGSGANIVITDSNRRQVFSPQYTQQNVGPVLTAGTPITNTEAEIDPFIARGTDAQTVTVLRGAAYLTAPSEFGFNQFPELMPIAAFDGNLNTSWVPYSGLTPAQRWLQIGFTRPRNIAAIDVYPLDGSHATVTALQVGARIVSVHPGWNRIAVNAHDVSSLRIRIAHVIEPRQHGGPGGITEIRIPGVSISQALRTPLLASKALAGQNLSHAGLTFLFARTTGDDPFRRDRYVDEPVQNSLADAEDPESQIDRVVFAPATRAYSVDARVTPATTAGDDVFDRLAGVRTSARFTSSSRFQNEPRYRASGAFDANPATAWVGLWIRPAAPPPWIAWTTRRPITVRRLTIAPAQLPVRHPTEVRLSWPGGSSPALAVGPGGSVVLPQPARAGSFRLTVLAAAFPAGLTARQRLVRAVGIGSLSVPDLPAVNVPHQGTVTGACGIAAVMVAGQRVPLRVAGTVGQMDAGLPLAAAACGATVTMPAGIRYVSSVPGNFSIDLLRLGSPAPAPLPAPAAGGRVIVPGTLGQYSVTHVTVDLRRPTWLVLGESYDSGWQASCDGRSLGAPQVIDGYANGWIAPAACHHVTFRFGPQSGVNLSYVISAATVILLALLLIFSRPPKVPERLSAIMDIGDPARRLAPTRAVATALGIAAVLGFIFAWRAGVVLFLLLALVFWRGVGARALAATGAVLLGVVVPILYAVTNPQNKGGFNFDYSVQLIYAHWIGVGAVVLLGLSAWRTMAAGRRAGPGLSRDQPILGSSRRRMAVAIRHRRRS